LYTLLKEPNVSISSLPVIILLVAASLAVTMSALSTRSRCISLSAISSRF
jgi:hypothetical protein